MIPFYERQENQLSLLGMHWRFQFPPHVHRHLELAVCHAGTVEVTVDAQTAELHAGDVALVCPHTVHSYRTLYDAPVEGLMILFDPLWLPNQGSALRKARAETPFIRASQLHRDGAYAIEALTKEWQQPSPDDDACRALMGLLLARLTPLLTLRPQDARDPGDLMHRAMIYLAECYSQPVTLEMAAQDLSVNPYHLSHLFSARLGMGFHAYVNALRLNQAEMLLRGSDLSITEICYDCGFDSQRTFNRVFKNAHGQTPRTFRKAGLEG